MTKINRLRIEALESCNWRGHDMKRFSITQTYQGKVGESECKKCKMLVHILYKPYPNEIEIGGEAVALNCFD